MDLVSGGGSSGGFRVAPGPLADAAGGFDAVAVGLVTKDVDIVKDELIYTGNDDLGVGLRDFAWCWTDGIYAIVGEQVRFAKGIREAVSDYLGVDADVAYAVRVLQAAVHERRG
ncbi:hypothetical protein [Nocardioides montaniterrae]